jgi:hypothetical protein
MHPYIKWNLANAIVKHRAQHGNYISVEDLKQIAVITPEMFEKISHYLTALTTNKGAAKNPTQKLDDIQIQVLKLLSGLNYSECDYVLTTAKNKLPFISVVDLEQSQSEACYMSSEQK